MMDLEDLQAAASFGCLKVFFKLIACLAGLAVLLAQAQASVREWIDAMLKPVELSSQDYAAAKRKHIRNRLLSLLTWGSRHLRENERKILDEILLILPHDLKSILEYQIKCIDALNRELKGRIVQFCNDLRRPVYFDQEPESFCLATVKCAQDKLRFTAKLEVYRGLIEPLTFSNGKVNLQQDFSILEVQLGGCLSKLTDALDRLEHGRDGAGKT
jgi:hypothetical protein